MMLVLKRVIRYRIIWLVIFQIIVILSLGLTIYKKRNTFTQQVYPIKHSNIKLSPTVNLKHFFEPLANTSIQEQEFYWLKNPPVYQHNSDTFREKKDYSVRKGLNVLRIAAIGDSFTFGLFISQDKVWSEILEKMLNQASICTYNHNYEVINMGVAGYDLEYSKERFIKRGGKYNPDIILWLVKDDDLQEINEIKYSIDIEEIKKTREYLQMKNEGLPYPENGIMNLKMTKILQQKSERSIVEYFNKIIYSLAESTNAKIIIATFPSTTNKHKGMLKKYNNEQIDYLELFNIYDKNIVNEVTFAPVDFHPNDEGHSKIAESFYEYLKDSNMVCN